MEQLGGIRQARAGRHRRGRAAIAAVLGAPWLAVASPVDAETMTAVVGVCLVSLDISSGTVGVPPIPPTTPTAVHVTGDGSCVVNGVEDVGIIIGGSLASAGGTTTWTCLGGVAVGQLTITVTHSKMPGAVTADVTLTAVGGVAVMTAEAIETSPAFVGEGNFVEDVTSQASCPTNGSAPTSWCGTFEFAQVDPDPPGR